MIEIYMSDIHKTCMLLFYIYICMSLLYIYICDVSDIHVS